MADDIIRGRRRAVIVVVVVVVSFIIADSVPSSYDVYI